jgi:hypothetical protein
MLFELYCNVFILFELIYNVLIINEILVCVKNVFKKNFEPGRLYWDTESPAGR